MSILSIEEIRERLNLPPWAATCSEPVFTKEGPIRMSSDPVEHPGHYTSHPSGVECLDITEHMNFCLGNVFKYIWRCDEKDNAIEDLKKARFYLDREIKRRERGAPSASR